MNYIMCLSAATESIEKGIGSLSQRVAVDPLNSVFRS